MLFCMIVAIAWPPWPETCNMNLESTKMVEKTSKSLLLGACVFALCAGAAHAEDRPKAYVNVGVNWYDIGEGWFGLQSRAGYALAPAIAIEGEASFGVNDTSLTIPFGDSEISGDVGVDAHLAAFLVAKTPAYDGVSLFARGGYYYGKFSGSNDLGSITLNSDNFAFGGGIEVDINDKNGIRLEYTAYTGSSVDVSGSDIQSFSLDTDDFSLDSVALSYVRRF